MLQNFFVLSQAEMAALCGLQQVVQLVLSRVPASAWQRHSKAIINAIWLLLRARKEDYLRDMVLLTAAQYFKYMLTLDSEKAPERLGKHYLQIFVNLLRSSGPEHDSDLVHEAVDAMMPCLGRYDVGSGAEPVPTWVNYVRKIIMENTDAGNSAHTSTAPALRSAVCPRPGDNVTSDTA